MKYFTQTIKAAAKVPVMVVRGLFIFASIVADYVFRIFPKYLLKTDIGKTFVGCMTVAVVASWLLNGFQFYYTWLANICLLFIFWVLHKNRDEISQTMLLVGVITFTVSAIFLAPYEINGLVEW